MGMTMATSNVGTIGPNTPFQAGAIGDLIEPQIENSVASKGSESKFMKAYPVP